jgi:hypothetical protein
VVAADRGSVAEHIRRSRAGLLFESGQARSLGDQLLFAISGAPAGASLAARTYVENQCSWTAALDRIFGTYEAIARQ